MTALLRGIPTACLSGQRHPGHKKEEYSAGRSVERIKYLQASTNFLQIFYGGSLILVSQHFIYTPQVHPVDPKFKVVAFKRMLNFGVWQHQVTSFWSATSSQRKSIWWQETPSFLRTKHLEIWGNLPPLDFQPAKLAGQTRDMFWKGNIMPLWHDIDMTFCYMAK